jgi:hypothetical protein
MNLQVIAGSCQSTYWGNGKTEYRLDDVELERLLDDIGVEKVKEYFGLVQQKEDYGVKNEDF